MDIKPHIIMKNLGTFTHAYGLEPNSKRLLDNISTANGQIESVGVLLRDPVTKKGLISCRFPVDEDITNIMLWVPTDERPLEAVPACTRQVGTDLRLKAVWKRLADRLSEDCYYEIEEGGFQMRVHQCFVKQGVIEKYLPQEGYGYIQRSRKGIYFKKQWCNLQAIDEGTEVSFIPLITRKGLQARAIEEVKS
ncbi:MAG: hypothetical protein Q8P24_15340 [Desulfobacterales bacterium]|nr:hypothetical protein [Desulfobacterales bacterium]